MVVSAAEQGHGTEGVVDAGDSLRDTDGFYNLYARYGT